MNLGFVSTGLKPVGEVEIPDIYYNRMLSGIELCDHLFGGGLIPSAVITVTSKPGYGKSTWMTQLLNAYHKKKIPVGYFGCEESEAQMAFRANRLGIESLPVANMNDLDDIIGAIDEHGLKIIVIDSFMGIKIKGNSLKGKAMQQFVVERLVQRAQLKGKECAIFILMHMTKAGLLKGDTIVPHTVDVNIVIRSGLKELGDKDYRIIDCPEKNRFGPLTEIITKHGPRGYIFDGIDQEIAIDVNTSKVSKRTKHKQEEMVRILDMDDSQAITPQRVMEVLGVDYAHAYGRLGELTKNGKLVKYGKGQDAVFKINKMNDTDDSDEDEE